VLRFERFRLDAADSRLWKDDEPVALSHKALAVLELLASRPGRLVTKRQLLDAVWAATHVSDTVLKVAVAELRRVLGDRPRAPRFIATVHRRGYRFVAAVEADASDGAGVGDEPPPAPRVVGRDRPLLALRQHLAAARARERRVVLVTGEPGIGKTALIEAFVDSQAADSLLIAWGQCRESYGEGEAFLPVLEALGSLCRSTLGEVVVAILRRHAPSWLHQMPWAVADDARAEVERAARDVGRARMLRELAEALEAISHARPLLLVFEDLHWSDPSTLDAFSALAHRTDPASLLIVGSYRPVDALRADHPVKGLTHDLVARRRGAVLAVALLNEHAVDTYLRAQLRGDPPPQASALVHRRSEGNPLFMVTYVADLLAQDCLTRGDDGWQLRRPLHEIEARVPAQLMAILEGRIDRLAARDLELLECASVIGREFASVTVAAILDAAAPEVEAAFERLGRGEDFVRPTGAQRLRSGAVTGRYEFGHVLLQHALYQRVGAARRADLHARVAERLAAEGGGAAQLAYHYHAAGLADAAIRAWEQAGHLAAARWANLEAMRHFEDALRLLAEQPESPARDAQELSLLIAIGTPYRSVYGPGAPRAAHAYERAEKLCARLNLGPQIYPLLAGLFAFYIGRARYSGAAEMAARMMRVAEPLGEPMILKSALLMTGIASLYSGRFSTSLASMDRAIALSGEEVVYHWDHHTVGLCFLFSSLTLHLMGRPEKARARWMRGLEMARQGADTHLLTMALQFASFLDRWRGDAAQTRAHALEVDSISREQGFELWSPVTGWSRGWADAAQGALAEGIAAMQKNLARYAASGTDTARTEYLAATAAACLQAGDIDAGLALVDEGLAQVAVTGERFAEAELHRVRAALLATGAPPGQGRAAVRARAAAEAAALRALEVARAQGARAWELRAATTLFDLRQRGGDIGEAHAILACVCATFDAAADLVDVREARVRLG
jgi:DNA-binding winged helix-turn-helix (wHTH) protein